MFDSFKWGETGNVETYDMRLAMRNTRVARLRRKPCVSTIGQQCAIQV